MLVRAATLAPVPATQIAQNLAFINWTAADRPGARAPTRRSSCSRRRTTATPGYLRFTTLLRARLRGAGLDLRRRAARRRSADSPVVVDPAWDAPAPRGPAAVLRSSSRLASSSGALAPRAAERSWLGGPRAPAVADARVRGPGLGRRRRSAPSSLLVQLAVVSAAIGGVFAAMILGHWYLVTPKLPEAPLILLARVLLVVVVVQVVLFWAWIATGAGPADVAPFSSLIGPWALFVWLRLIVGLVFPLVVSLGVGPDRPDPLDGVGDGPAVHQRRIDRGRDDPGRGPLFRRRPAGVRTTMSKNDRDWIPDAIDLDWIESLGAAAARRRWPPSRPPPSRSASRSSTATAGRVLRVLAGGRRRIVEVGTAYGYSTLWMALGQPADGTIVTIDPDRERTDLARGWWRQAGHRRRADHGRRRAGARRVRGGRPGARRSVRPRLHRCAQARVRRPTSRRSSAALAPGALVVADNVLWSGRVSGARPVAADDANTAALRAFDAAVLADPRFSATILPVGDGLLVAVVARLTAAASVAIAHPRPAVRGPARAGRDARGRRSSCRTAPTSRTAWAALVDALPGPRAGPRVGPVRPQRRLRRRRRRRSPTATRSR